MIVFTIKFKFQFDENLIRFSRNKEKQDDVHVM